MAVLLLAVAFRKSAGNNASHRGACQAIILGTEVPYAGFGDDWGKIPITLTTPTATD